MLSYVQTNWQNDSHKSWESMRVRGASQYVGSSEAWKFHKLHPRVTGMDFRNDDLEFKRQLEGVTSMISISQHHVIPNKCVQYLKL